MIRLLVNIGRLAMLLSVIGGGAVAWTYYRSDELLRVEVLRQLGVALPDARITLERANFDLQGRIRLFDLAIALPEDSKPSLSIPETLITIDSRRFTDQQVLIIQDVTFRQPRLRMVRGPDGRWNWQNTTFIRPEGADDLPDLSVTHGVVELVLADHATRTMVNLPLEQVNITATPISHRAVTVQLTAQTEFTGQVQISGELPLETAPWKLQVAAARLKFDAATTRLALIVAPQLQPRFEELRERLAGLTPLMTPDVPQAERRPSADPHDLGVSWVGSARCHLAQADLSEPPTVNVQVQIEDGRLAHPVLPGPLFDLRGQVQTDGRSLWVKGVTARTGHSRLALEATVPTSGRWQVALDAEAVPIDDALVLRLPDGLQKHVRSLELTGVVSARVHLRHSDTGRPEIQATGSLTRGTLRHELFPYRVHDVSATGVWQHDTVQLQGQGLAGTTPVRGVGTIHDPGPEGDATFDIRADGLTMDDALRQALPPIVAKVVDELQFQGRGDAWVRLIRPPGLDQKYRTLLLANLREAAVQYREFPYAVSNLSGRLRWDGDVVQFEQMRGEHEGSVITGSGRYDVRPEPGRLTMSVQTEQTAFDRALYSALPAHLQEAWQSLSPRGQFDATAHLDWTPGQPVQIDVPRMVVKSADVQLRDFPYRFTDFHGQMSYLARERKLTIHEMSARRDDTRVSGQGFVVHNDDGAARITFEKLHVDDLLPTPTFRRALPETLRSAIEAINPTGSWSFHGPVSLHVDPHRGGLTSADWDWQLLLAGCSLNAGLRIDNVHGRVHLKGRWTPSGTEISGQLNLDALDVFTNHQLTRVRGPIKLKDGVLLAGSAEMVNHSRGTAVTRVPVAERLIGEAFDGEVTLDAIVDLNKAEPEYAASMELTGASLEKYAMRHLRGHSNVRGLMNGWMDIRGAGVQARGLSGEGQLQVSPAALYELPVFLQIFQLPQFSPINRTAFDYANFVFTIENERFNFQAMDLVGNTISLRGRGAVRFDGAVMLDFYSMQPRNQVRVPGLREIVGFVNLVSQGWVAIEVRGPIWSPVARVVPLPAVDEALQQFLGAFNPRVLTPPPIPWRAPPRTTFAPDTAPQ